MIVWFHPPITMSCMSVTAAPQSLLRQRINVPLIFSQASSKHPKWIKKQLYLHMKQDDTVYFNPPAQHQWGAIICPLHLGPLILHNLHTIFIPGKLRIWFAFEEDVNGGCVACLYSHWLSPQQVQWSEESISGGSRKMRSYIDGIPLILCSLYFLVQFFKALRKALVSKRVAKMTTN